MLELITLPSLPLAIGIGLLLCAGYWESKTLRVPNALTLGALLAAVLFATARTWFAPQAIGGIGAALIGMVVGGVLLLPLYVRFGLGAGCVKAQAAFGAWMGCAFGVEAGIMLIVVATICACIMLAANALSHPRLLEHDAEYGRQVAHGQLPLSIGALVGLVVATWM